MVVKGICHFLVTHRPAQFATRKLKITFINVFDFLAWLAGWMEARMARKTNLVKRDRFMKGMCHSQLAGWLVVGYALKDIVLVYAYTTSELAGRLADWLVGCVYLHKQIKKTTYVYMKAMGRTGQ